MQVSNEEVVLNEDAALEFIVEHGVLRERLDKVLARLLPQHSRGRLQTWIESGHVKVNGAVQTRIRTPVQAQDRIAVFIQPDETDSFEQAQAVEFDVVAQSEQWLVIHKPAGLVVHPGAGNWSHTLLNGLLFRYPELGALERAGIVHRLDKETSGLMVVARTQQAQDGLIAQMQARSVMREYIAVTHGHVQTDEGTIDRPVGRDPRVAVRMTVTRPIAPKEARTDFSVNRRGFVGSQMLTVLACRLQTGRTHQIRVHMASLGHPLVGDALYGAPKKDLANRQMLHARRLAFDDPHTGVRQTFECALPPDMTYLLEQIT